MIDEKLNIQPQAAILGAFSRLSYKPEYAIAEFVDNSTASFLGHKELLKECGVNKVTIWIEYDHYQNTLTIKDDAYGMNLQDFKRALLLEQEPDHLNGRNEFGMGLKTAASWFGNCWTVQTTRLNSKEEYTATIDIEELKKSGSNFIDIHNDLTNENEHGTKITIKKLTKKISSKAKKKVIELLTSIYRRDLKSKEIEIYFDGIRLVPEELEPLYYSNKTWKKELDFQFLFENKTYHVTGFIGILKKGGFAKAGLSLFRYNRIVLGGIGQKYKPAVIFGQPQSQISLKLYGELNMEDFPVNQAKDGFIWDDGLEEAFLEKLKHEIKEYIQIAEISTKDRIENEMINKSNSDEIKEKVSKELNEIILDEQNCDKSNYVDLSKLDDVELYEYNQNKQNNLIEHKESELRTYNIKIDKVNNEQISVKWELTNNSSWLNYDEKHSIITINLNHSFFKPYIEDKEFQKKMELFVIGLIIAENLTEKTTYNLEHIEGMMRRKILHENINSILMKISETKNNK